MTTAKDKKDALEKKRELAKDKKEALEKKRKLAKEKKEALEKKRKLAKDKKEALEKKRKLAKDKKEALAEKKKIAEDKKTAKKILSLAEPVNDAPATKTTPAVKKTVILNNDIIQIRTKEAETLRKEIGLNTAETAVCVKKGAEILKKLNFVVERLGVFRLAHQKSGLNADIIQIRMKESDALRKLIELNTAKTSVCLKKGSELVKKLVFVEKRLEILHPTRVIKRKHTADGKAKPAVNKTEVDKLLKYISGK